MVTTRPNAHSYIIKRPRLTKLLAEAGARILLLCAPAGYGKTTLAREWVASRNLPVAWYSGGSEMLDASGLSLSLIGALGSVGLAVDGRADLAAIATSDAMPEVVGQAIARALAPLPTCIVVVDDNHHAEES